MTLMADITRAPVAVDPAYTLDFLDGTEDLSADAIHLLRATAQHSPYLTSLMAKERDWLLWAFSTDTAGLMDQILDAVDMTSEATLSSSLRQAKRRVALLAALCDLGGVWSLQQVTAALTRLADFAVHTSLRTLVALDVKAGRLPAEALDDPENCGGIFVLAMGKMGARELNYSSDIDLIVLFNNARFQPDDVMTVRSVFIKTVRKMTRILSDITAEGYVFRTDLRLRPNPSVTPVCFAADAALRYYESMGRTWERAAFIKARVCAGDAAAGAEFLDELKPFIWRKHLDFAAVRDAHDMQTKIREHKGLKGKISLLGHDLKLGRGGIREIEFFAQTRQLIAGGRDVELRDRGTVKTLTDLAAKGWIEPDIATQLITAYEWLRGLEHRVQMINDAQTQHLPASDDKLAAIATFSGYAEYAAFSHEALSLLERVHALTESFFAPDEQQEQPLELSEADLGIVDQWYRLPALRSRRAVEIFERLKPALLAKLTSSGGGHEAISEFDRFISRLPAGVQLFSLFESNPQILDLLAQICTTSPSLSAYLGRNANVLDAVVTGGFFEPLPDRAALVLSLKTTVLSEPDYEDQLIAARRWQKERHFRIGVLQLRGLASSTETAKSYSDLASACLEVIIPVFHVEFARKYGDVPGSGIAVLAMGKLGSDEMTPTSDLDLILVYDPAGQIASDGPKELAVTTYFSRFTHGMITALSSQMGTFGRLYEVDMRLRPSGRSGPVATSLKAFEDYQEHQAWTWEHLALTRAQFVAGDKVVGAKVQAIRKRIIERDRDRVAVADDVLEMRQRIAKGKASTTPAWDIKSRAGGMLDIELMAQSVGLLSKSLTRKPSDQLSDAALAGLISQADADVLCAAHVVFKTYQSDLRLLLEEGRTPDELGQGGCGFLLGALDADSLSDLQEKFENTAKDCANRIDRQLKSLSKSTRSSNKAM